MIPKAQIPRNVAESSVPVEASRFQPRVVEAPGPSGTVQVGQLGWLPDLPDLRDFHSRTPEVSRVLAPLKIAEPVKDLPAAVDLREWCSEIEDQGNLGSCTANAGVGLYEFFERKAYGRHIDASRLFLYKATRNLLGWTGDTGAYLRTTMGALRLFGTVPEKYWPYATADFEKDPPPFCWAFAENYQATVYYRLDPAGIPRPELVARMKTNLAASLPSMFGFTVYSSISQAAARGEIPFPASGERVLGGHAMVAVGYDDAKKIRNSNPGGAETTGAFLIRNSWGTSWAPGAVSSRGEPMPGYGWLPYEYVLRFLLQDVWTLVRGEFEQLGRFGL